MTREVIGFCSLTVIAITALGLIFGFTPLTIGIGDVITLSFMVGREVWQYTSGFHPRVVNTPSEDLFNVVNIDRNRKAIKIIRIGSDASVTGQVRDQMIMSYATT